MGDSVKIRVFAILMLVGLGMFAYSILNFVNIKKKNSTFTDEFLNNYNNLNLQEYVTGEEKTDFTDLKERLMNDKTVNDILNNYIDVNKDLTHNTIADNINDAYAYNFLRCANNVKSVYEVTEGEKIKYYQDYKNVLYRVSRKDFNAALKELMNVDLNDPLPDTQYSIYEKENDSYYLLDWEARDEYEIKRRFMVRNLRDIKEEDGIYTLYIDRYNVISKYGSILEDLETFLRDAVEKDYKYMYNMYLENKAAYSWDYEIVKLKELPDGVYVKYQIVEKDEYAYNVFKNNGIYYYMPLEIVEKKPEGNLYTVKVRNGNIIEFIEGNKFMNKIYYPGDEFVYDSKTNYNVGELVYKSKVLMTEEGITFRDLEFLENE